MIANRKSEQSSHAAGALIVLGTWVIMLMLCMPYFEMSFRFSVVVATTFAVFAAVACFIDDYLSPPAFLFAYVLLGTLDVFFVAVGAREVAVRQSEETYIKAIFIIFLWLVSFLLSYRLARPFGRQSRRFPTVDARGLDFTYANGAIVLIVVVLFVYSIVRAVRKSIDLGGLVTGMLYGGAAFEDQGYLMMLLSFSGLIPVVLMYKGHSKWAVASSLVIMAGIALTGRRSLAVTTAVVPALIYYNYRVRRIRGVVLLGAVLAVAVFVLFIGAIRTATEPNATAEASALGTLTTLTKYIGYGTNFPDMIFALDSGAVPFQGPRYLLRGLEYFVPRGLWPDKPLVHSSNIVSDLIYSPDDVGRPVGAFGWGYLCFGYPGVLAAGALSGVVSKKIFTWALSDAGLYGLLYYSITVFAVLEIVTPEAQMRMVFCGVMLWMFAAVSRRREAKTFARRPVFPPGSRRK